MVVPEAQQLDAQPLDVAYNHWTTKLGRRHRMYEHFFEIWRKEEDGSRTRVRRVRIPSRVVLRILAGHFREKLHTSATGRRGRPRGRPARKDVTKAFQLIRQGVPRKEIYKLFHVLPAGKRSFKQALWRRERHRRRKAEKGNEIHPD